MPANEVFGARYSLPLFCMLSASQDRSQRCLLHTLEARRMPAQRPSSRCPARRGHGPSREDMSVRACLVAFPDKETPRRYGHRKPGIVFCGRCPGLRQACPRVINPPGLAGLLLRSVLGTGQASRHLVCHGQRHAPNHSLIRCTHDRRWGGRRLRLSRLRQRDRSSDRSWFAGSTPDRPLRATPGGTARATILQRSVPEAIRLLTRVLPRARSLAVRLAWQKDPFLPPELGSCGAEGPLTSW